MILRGGASEYAGSRSAALRGHKQRASEPLRGHVGQPTPQLRGPTKDLRCHVGQSTPQLRGPSVATMLPTPQDLRVQSPFLATVSNRTLASMSVRDHSASLPMAPLSRPPTEVLTSPNKSNHAVCRHGRRKVTCKECGGSGLCGHGRQKSTCRECGGSSFCRHGRRKSVRPIYPKERPEH